MMKMRFVNNKLTMQYRSQSFMKWSFLGLCLLCSCDFESPGSRQPDHDHGDIRIPPPRIVSSKWSNPRTWPDGKVPVAGQKVVLPKGKRILLDVSTASLGGLEIPMGSALEFDRKNLKLTSEWIMVDGELRVGSEKEPFKQKAEIELTNKIPNEDIKDMGDRVLGVMGKLELHGHKHVSWTRLTKTAPKGGVKLYLEKAPDWKNGDRLTLATTDFDALQTEEVTVKSVNGNVVILTEPLKYPHFVQNIKMGGKMLKHTAEVGLLTRNIRIFAGADAEKSGFGAHSMVMGRGIARVEGVEFNRVGQRNLLRRYPFHYHLIGDASKSYFRNNSIHESYNRCISIHGTNNLRFEKNVTYNNVGHCIFLEDGNEVGNNIESNLVTLVRTPDQKKGEKPLLDSDKRAAAYWLSNPDNTIVNNVAAGMFQMGFWFAFPEHPTGLGAPSGKNIWPRRTPVRKFEGNVAHGGLDGVFLGLGPDSSGSTVEQSQYHPVKDPSNPKSEPALVKFENNAAYKMRGRGMWFIGSHMIVSNAVISDSAAGITLPSNETVIKNSLLVGETANKGYVMPNQPSGKDGRSLPRPWAPEYPIRGVEFYSGKAGVENVAFAGYKSNAQRKASGFGVLIDLEKTPDPQNYVRNIKWLDNSQRVYFNPASPEKDGEQGAIFQDVDGSVTGQKGVSLTSNPLLIKAKDCKFNKEWNGAVCQGNYARAWVQNRNSKAEVGTVHVVDAAGSNVTMYGLPGTEATLTTSVRLGRSYTFTPKNRNNFRIGITDTDPKLKDAMIKIILNIGKEPYLYRSHLAQSKYRLTKASLNELDKSDSFSYAYKDGKVYLNLKTNTSRNRSTVTVCYTKNCK